MYDFYGNVPKGYEDNLAYRWELRHRCRLDKKLRDSVWLACKHDVLFWMNSLTWLYEPRDRFLKGVKLRNTIPLISWTHQDPIIRELRDKLGQEDIGIEKSRGEGASWIAVLLALHDWLFEDMAAIGLVSRNEKAADSPKDPDSLFWKIDWELKQLPAWMAGQPDVDWVRILSDHTLYNVRNGSTIAAYAATSDVASGGRKKWFLMDELAKFPSPKDEAAMDSTQHVTDSRLVVSTPLGAQGAYYNVMKKQSNMIKLVLDWKDNETRNRGLYELIEGMPKAVDPINNPLPDIYNPPTEQVKEMYLRLKRNGFALEKRLRSPWYDNQCDRAGATPQGIAQELDRDYGGSAFLYFQAAFFNAVENTVRAPTCIGELTFNPETLEGKFDHTRNGQLKLWCDLDQDGQPPKDDYVVGCDVSTGSGGAYTSNSTMVVLNMRTGEQVAEFAANTIEEYEFCDLAIAISKFFYDAYLIWEANGPGNKFTARVKDRHYGNIYKRTTELKRTKKKTQDLGWWSSPQTRTVLFGNINSMVQERKISVRSESIREELAAYIYSDTRKIVHSASLYSQDPNETGENHGDRVIALGVACHGVKDRPAPEAKAEPNKNDPDNPEPGTMAWRTKQYWETSETALMDWDDRGPQELAHRENMVFENDANH